MSKSQHQAIQSAIKEVLPEVIALRHHLHQNPELSDQEEKTAAFVAEMLRSFGIEEIKMGVGGHGIVATLHGTAEKRYTNGLFALRADMDALPIQEESDVPYRSCVPGVMHACGHDGHTATLLGTAAVLSRLRERLQGSVRLIFQPAEETVGGAVRMCANGALEGVEAIVALHGWPGLAPGQIAVRSGAMMASSDTFDIVIKGKGTHAAMPQAGIDPILIGAHIVTALQSLSSREVAPTEAVVVTISQLHAGTAYNVIPESATLKGTVRCLTKSLRESMPERLERVVQGICSALRAEYEFRYRLGVGVTTNDAQVNALVEEVGTHTLGEENVISLSAPSMGAEDFSAYLDHVPGAMFRLGVGTEKPMLHNSRYDFGDEALPVGMEVFLNTAFAYLGKAVER